MLRVDVPSRGTLELQHLVLDVNGTIALDGRPIPGVAQALSQLTDSLHIVAITADTHGTADALRESLGIDIHVIATGAEAEQKLLFVQQLGAQSVVAIGNGENDQLMLAEAAIGIAVMGGEGLSVSSMVAADIVTTSIADALGLLSNPARLVATARR